MKKIEVLYPAVHNVIHKRKPAKNIRLLFIGGYYASFERKGGDDVLRLFNILRHYYNNIELTFIGLMPKNVYNKYKKYKNLSFFEEKGTIRDV